MSRVRVIATASVAVLIVLLVLYADGKMGTFLCRHFKGGWLEKQGFIECYRGP
jgi:hypothetical protein